MENRLETSQHLTIPFFRILAVSAILVMGMLFFFPVFYSVNEAAAIAVPLLVLVCGIALNKKLKLDKWTAEIYVFLSFWLIYALFGLLWVKDTNLAYYYIRRILFYLLVFIVSSQFFKHQKYRESAPLFLQLVFLGYCLIYMWEMATGMHLPSSRLYGVPLPIPTGAFYNENNSAVFMLLLAPFLTVKTRLTTSRLGKTVALVLFLFMLVVSLVQSSRLALAMIFLLGIYYFIRAGLYIKIASLILITLSLAVFIIGFPKEANFAGLILHRQLTSLEYESKSYLMTSSKIRHRLNIESINLAAESRFFGTGAGSYETYLNKGRYHRTSWVLNPHNWWMELLANFGLLITLGMIFIYLRWLFRLWQLRQASEVKHFDLYDAYFVSLIMFIPLSIIPSSIKSYYSIWLYFGLIHSVCLAGKLKSDILEV
ncbi:MAG: O-antigen ligase family protein [Candidatus Cloacimonadaceae bacterium]